MTYFPWFVFGLIMGSFLNVIAVRYDPDRFIFSPVHLKGRSHCPHCGKKLRWYELIPLLSFLVQGGLCRSCKKRLSFQYPVVELISGIIFVVVPWRLGLTTSPVVLGIWIAIFLSLLVVSLIDLRLRLIPDEINVLIIFFGGLLVFLTPHSNFFHTTFIGHYALLLGNPENIWLGHIWGFVAGFLFFLALILLSRATGMGGGDMKLGGALGFLFGWPDIVVVIPLSFILGTVFALPLLLSGRRKRKDFLPFGPFLALSSMIVFLWGFQIVDFYFSLFRG